MRYIGFDAVAVEWATFRPDRDNPSNPPTTTFQAYAQFVNDEGVTLPLSFNGWHPNVTLAARQAVEAAILEVTYQMIAAELQLGPGDGLKLDVGKIRIAADGETPDWILEG